MAKNSKRNYKNEIVSLGVLGTFIGIAIGLYHFDVANIKDSMPALLGGLKTAFITSGIGIFGSIIISINKPFKQKNIQALIENLKTGSYEVKNSLESTTSIVKEQMQLLLREANRKL
jgi:biopolymer transport protein ExbB/TolQ